MYLYILNNYVFNIYYLLLYIHTYIFTLSRNVGEYHKYLQYEKNVKQYYL